MSEVRLFLLIGDPIDHSLGTILHENIFRQTGLNAEYSKIRCDEEDIPNVLDYLRSGELDGINVTIPYKKTVIEHLDELNPRARLIQSVNTVAHVNDKLVGYNTDWWGFSMLLRNHDIHATGRSIIIFGTGGSAHSVAYALIQGGAGMLIFVTRDKEHGQALIDSLSIIDSDTILTCVEYDKFPPLVKPNSIIINTTPLGMGDFEGRSPMSTELMMKDQILIDLIYNPLETEFIYLGKLSGATTINGLDMFIHQGLLSLDTWYGKAISSNVNIQKITAELVENL